jgi:hypothetical protein
LSSRRCEGDRRLGLVGGPKIGVPPCRQGFPGDFARAGGWVVFCRHPGFARCTVCALRPGFAEADEPAAKFDHSFQHRWAATPIAFHFCSSFVPSWVGVAQRFEQNKNYYVVKGPVMSGSGRGIAADRRAIMQRLSVAWCSGGDPRGGGLNRPSVWIFSRSVLALV